MQKISKITINMAKTKQQTEDTNVVSLKTLTKSSVWDVQENDIFRMLDSGIKDADIRRTFVTTLT